MTDIRIFNSELFAESGTEKHLQMFGTLCFLLAEAVDAEDKKLAWQIMNEASKIGHALDSPAFNSLYAVAAMEITRNSANKKK